MDSGGEQGRLGVMDGAAALKPTAEEEGSICNVWLILI